MMKKEKDPLLSRRIAMLIGGNVLCGAGVGIFRYIGFGTDPYNSGVLGLWNLTGLFDFGTFSMVLCLALLAVDLIFFDRRKIGIGTFLNMFLVGYVIEFVTWLLQKILPGPVLAVRVIFLIAALILVCYASSMYYVADLGVSPYDCIPISIAQRTHWHFRTVRIIADCLWVLVGIAGGQMPGIATVLIAFCLGPFIEMFHPLNKALLEHTAFRSIRHHSATGARVIRNE